LHSFGCPAGFDQFAFLGVADQSRNEFAIVLGVVETFPFAELAKVDPTGIATAAQVVEQVIGDASREIVHHNPL
jgi:hypothetical protein